MLRAARTRTTRMEVSGEFAVRVRKGGRVGGGCHSNGISEAVVNVAGPEPRGEQAKRRDEKTAVHAKQLVLVGGSQLEGTNGLDARNELDHDKHVGRAVSQ